MADLPPWSGSSSGAPGDGTVTDVKVAAGAAIQQSKLALAITNAEVAAGAAIAKSKLAALALVDADVAAGAAIAGSKLALTTGVHITDLFANRPAAAAGLNGAKFFATDKLMEWTCVAAAWVLTAVLAPEVGALPAGPVDQQECVFVADAAAGVKWHLRYRAASASALKWEYMGGPPLRAKIPTFEGPGTVAYAALTTAGPSIVVPLAGDYDVQIVAQITNNANPAYSYMSYDVGATAALDTDAALMRNNAATAVDGTFNKESRKTGLAASDAIVAKYKATAGVGTWGDRSMRVAPVRVG